MCTWKCTLFTIYGVLSIPSCRVGTAGDENKKTYRPQYLSTSCLLPPEPQRLQYTFPLPVRKQVLQTTGSKPHEFDLPPIQCLRYMLMHSQRLNAINH
ncbi:hypothetical protein F4778DRAFT_89338 [Xylariomycetidae sp. FL2044]|nr:hypothetical protein F4778DRAFT_89338 [Xylariomycetidae sp. FL2044]